MMNIVLINALSKQQNLDITWIKIITSFFYQLRRPMFSSDSKRSIHKNHNKPWNKRAYSLIDMKS